MKTTDASPSDQALGKRNGSRISMAGPVGSNT